MQPNYKELIKTPRRLRYGRGRHGALLLTLLLTLSWAAHAATTVYVTKTGKKYHTRSCAHVRKSGTPMPLEEAIRAGYEPCSQCHPPTAKGAEHAKQSGEGDGGEAKPKRSAPASKQCAATTEKGARCKRNAEPGSAYCWQHRR